MLGARVLYEGSRGVTCDTDAPLTRKEPGAGCNPSCGTTSETVVGESYYLSPSFVVRAQEFFQARTKTEREAEGEGCVSRGGCEGWGGTSAHLKRSRVGGDPVVWYAQCEVRRKRLGDRDDGRDVRNVGLRIAFVLRSVLSTTELRLVHHYE